MKKFLSLALTFVIAFCIPFLVFAKEKVNVYLFWGNGCPHCEEAKEFFASIEDEYSKYFNLVEYEVWYSEENSDLMENVADYFGEDVSGVPYIIIGDKTFSGYASSMSEEIKDTIVKAYENKDYVDEVSAVINGDAVVKKNYDTYYVIAILAVVVLGFGALIYFSRKEK